MPLEYINTDDLHKNRVYEPKTLRVCRQSRGMTLSELSKKTGINAGTLSKYENDAQKIKYKDIVVIAKALEYPISMFMEHIERSHIIACSIGNGCEVWN